MLPSNHPADRRLWYVADPRVQTLAAARNAAGIAERIGMGGGESEPSEQELFAALHTCAFRVARRPDQRPITTAHLNLWSRRWQLIRDHIAKKNLGLVHLISRRFRIEVLDDDDLVSEAMFSLGRAIDRFDPWRGFRFSTYACNVITRALSRRSKGENRYRRLFPVQHDASFDTAAEGLDSRKELYLERLHRALQSNLGELTATESIVLSRRFAADHEPTRTFEQIGSAIGLSKERVRQIQNNALKKLREVLSLDPVLR